jgi:hypothetical protein
MSSNSISENILLLFCGLGILQGILLAALIYFHPKSDKSVNKFLALYIFCISSVMTMPIAMSVIGWRNSYFIQPIPLLPEIFLYFYLLSFKETLTWRKALPHFIIVFIFFFLTYWNLAAIVKIYPDAKHVPVEALKRPATLTIMLIRTVQLFLYFFLSRRALKSYQHSIQHLFSDTSRIDLHWARFLVNGYLVLISAFLVIFPLLLRYPPIFRFVIASQSVSESQPTVSTSSSAFDTSSMVHLRSASLTLCNTNAQHNSFYYSTFACIC